MPNSIRSIEVNLCDNITRKFLYNHLDMIELWKSVENEKGSYRISKLTTKSTALEGVMKESVAPGSKHT